MKFDLMRPCTHCPFRTDIDPYLTKGRAKEIVRSLERSTFECHETTGVKGPKRDPQHCAGALIMLEHAEKPSQMMRIAERLRLYDRSQLVMSAPVYSDPLQWVEAQE